ncbi:MAG: hypothetical protein RIR89_676 [Actinomycetota bacterium]
MSWLILLASLVGLYFFGLAIYRLFLSGKALGIELKRSGELLAELNSFERVEPESAKATTGDDFSRVLAARKVLVRAKIRRREDERRRLINRIREIDVDKRWS